MTLTSTGISRHDLEIIDKIIAENLTAARKEKADQICKLYNFCGRLGVTLPRAGKELKKLLDEN